VISDTEISIPTDDFSTGPSFVTLTTALLEIGAYFESPE
jgi:hypothetical protein